MLTVVVSVDSVLVRVEAVLSLLEGSKVADILVVLGGEAEELGVIVSLVLSSEADCSSL